MKKCEEKTRSLTKFGGHMNNLLSIFNNRINGAFNRRFSMTCSNKNYDNEQKFHFVRLKKTEGMKRMRANGRIH